MDPEFVQDLQDPDYVEAFIKEWNESRLDMFALSPPNEDLQFSGVMRFYFQDRGQKAVTKCVRVNNEQTVRNIMPTLIEKFCPDMKMLATPNYELYEIHGTGDVRKLSLDEKPLLVQLFWHKDDREGRFVLKDGNVKIQPIKFFEMNQDEGQLKRRLSRREKKDLKKKRKEEYELRSKNNDKALVDKVYNELPESSLTRTISNPEAVMRRRRQQKLEKRIKEFQNKEGPQTGGILKIFAESLKPEIPYKTILASVKDNAETVTIAALEKFLITKEHPNNFCIVMAIIPPGDPKDPANVRKERVIRGHDCPLAIQNSWPKSKGILTFHLRRKHGVPEPPPAPKDPVTNKKSRSLSTSSKKAKVEVPKPPPTQKSLEDRRQTSENVDKDLLPYFLELTPEGKEINYKPKIYYIRPHETVIGSSRNPSVGVQYMQLFSPKILPSHCSIVNADGTVSMVPHGPDADVRILGKRIYDTSLLKTGDIVQFGGLHTFRFCNPLDDSDDASSLASEGFRESLIHSSNIDLPSYNKNDIVNSSVSPEMMELILNEQVGSRVDNDHEIETTFGVSGEVETNKTKKQMYSAKSVDNLQDTDYHQQLNQLRDSFRKHRQSAPDILNSLQNDDELLPASLSFIDNGKDAFFAAVISEVNGAALSFKLAPTYTLYLAARFVLSQNFRPGSNLTEQAWMVSNITKQIAISLQQTIQENDCLAGGLAFWMANASELLHFYRQDIDLGPITQTAQAILAQSIQEAFALLVNAMEEQLSLALPAFLDPSDSVDIHPQELDAILNDEILERAESMELLNWASDDNHRTFRISEGPNGATMGEQWVTPAIRIQHHGVPIMADILYILSSAMSLLRRCRVNAALTIQLFSQLFHYINMWIFNRIVLEPDLRLCTRLWGNCLRIRLSYVEAWAERQGLELAADCHLARIVQTAHLLEAHKDTIEDLADLTSTCFKLNSLQIRALLENYLPEDYEPLLPQDVIDSIVSIAESTSDELTHNDGREVKLEEDIQLQLPFLLPEEGYSSDIIRGVPPGLQEFLDPLCATGLCDLTLNPQSMGVWTVYQEPYKDSVDESRDSQVLEDLPIQRVTIDKGKSGLGLSICSAKGAHSDFTGIYIKAVIKGSLADKDGRIHAGDQILSVNETGLVDVTQTQAAQIMGKSGSIITMEIIKGAAFYHGLAGIIEDEGPKDALDGTTTHSKQSNSLGDPTKANIANNNKSLQNNPQKQIETQKESVSFSENASKINEMYNDSDFDEDGNFLTKDEKEKLARQKQREREYEERLAKWEAERLKREADEAAIRAEQQRLQYNDSGEEEQDHEMVAENVYNEANIDLLEQENNNERFNYEQHIEHENNQRLIMFEKEQQRIDREEERRLQYEREQQRIEEEILQQEQENKRLAREVEQRMIEKKERERVDQEREQQRLEAERRRQYEEEQEQIRVKREQEYQKELREKKERERIEQEREQQRLEAERRKKQYEEEQEQIRLKREQEYQKELREKKERERIEQEREQQRLEAERRRQYEEEQEQIRVKREQEYQKELREKKERERIEQEREQQRLEAERRKKQYEEEQEQIRLKREQEYQKELREKKERERIEQEREQQRLEAERRKKQYEEEQEQIRLKREQEYQKELREKKERERIEQEREQQRLEAERRRQYEEEQEQIRLKREQEYQKELREKKERERIEQEREQQRLEAERRRQYEEEQEQIRIKKEQQFQNELRAKKERERIEQEREQQRLDVERRKKQYEEEQEQIRIKREHDYKKIENYQNPIDKMRKLQLKDTPTKRGEESNELDKEMASIDDALREAERIAAEMDFLMFEEEQKIEEDSKKKRKEEEFDWEKSEFKPDQGRNQYKSFMAKSSTEFFPPPPEDLLFVSTPQQNRYEPSRVSYENDKTRNSSSSSLSWSDKILDQQQKSFAGEENKRDLLKSNEQLKEGQNERRSPAVKPKNFKSHNQTPGLDSTKGKVDINNLPRGTKFPSISSKSKDGFSSDEEAPPRPPPPKNISSPISSRLHLDSPKGSSQTNGYQDISPDKSFGVRPITVLIKDGEPEVLDFKSKMKLFGNFQG